MAGNPECKNGKHVFHICALRACGLNETGDMGYGRLINDPKFPCEKCGAKANKSDNLCSPKKI